MDECSLWQRIRHQLRESCANLDGVWIKRRRTFNTELLLRGLLHLCGSRGQQSYQRVMTELAADTFSVPAASSFCEARTKVPSFVFGEVRRDILDAWDENRPKKELWHGYEPHAVDGSKVNLPRQLLKLGYKISGTGHYPLGLASLLVRMSDQMVCDVRLAKCMDERNEAHEHLTHLGTNDLVVYDRGYMSFALVTAHIHQNTQAVFRVGKENTYLVIRKFWNSIKSEAIVTIDPTTLVYKKSIKRCPEYEFGPIQLRLIKYEINNEIYVLATTLLDCNIPAQDFVELYARRWRPSEETYKVYKQSLELETFHSISENGVRQELEAVTLLWNLSRMLSSFAESAIKKTRGLLNFIPLSDQFSPKYI